MADDDWDDDWDGLDDGGPLLPGQVIEYWHGECAGREGTSPPLTIDITVTGTRLPGTGPPAPYMTPCVAGCGSEHEMRPVTAAEHAEFVRDDDGPDGSIPAPLDNRPKHDIQLTPPPLVTSPVNPSQDGAGDRARR